MKFGNKLEGRVYILLVCKRMQQLPKSLGTAVHRGKNTTHKSFCNPCVRSVRGLNNVGRAVQMDPTLLRYASAITEQKKCGELLAEKFDRFQTLRNNTQQHPTTCNRVCKRMQHVTSNNVGSCWPTMFPPFARGFTLGTSEMSAIFFFSQPKQLNLLPKSSRLTVH